MPKRKLKPKKTVGRALKVSEVRRLGPIEFPPQLGELTSPPKELYIKGPLPLGALGNSFAIVGTRHASEYGLKFARECAAFLAKKGVTIVSGLALGIDAAAHQGALEVEGSTVAVLGTGIERIYPPENQALFAEIAKKGLLMSEWPGLQPPEKFTFPLRNRLVTALSKGVLVVESDLEGGAMITAEIAQKMGRRLFALPGRIDQRSSRGPHRLIQQGATLVTSPEELWQLLNDPTLKVTPIKKPGPRSKKPRTRVFSLPVELAPLGEGQALTLDELAERARVPVSQLMMTLLTHELEGNVVKRLDGKYEAV